LLSKGDKMTKTQGKRVPKRVAVYLRVSTTEQATTNQRRELRAVAKRHGWSVVQEFEDAGISGAKGRKDRPALDALLKSVARREVDMVAAWSVDRLGRSLTDLSGVTQLVVGCDHHQHFHDFLLCYGPSPG
jgi:DNA invertase Pin-like site-specific DNA recombinase